jgi:Reverse transcriptase (RNA-dependent DNA polymerase)/GAG-pre-integrase domain/gag-polypeptide of LTR copia-type
MSGIPSLTILSEEQKFNGENLLQWKTNIIQLLGSKGLLGYIDGKIVKPTQTEPPKETTEGTTAPTVATTPVPTPIYSSSPTLDEWIFRDQLARGHITLNCVDVASLGVNTSGTAKDAWNSILEEWGRSTDMRRSHAQEALNRTEFVEGSDIQDHIKLLRTRKVAVDNLSTQAMSDEAWRGILIRSIPPSMKWLPVIPSLYSMTTSADIISTLLAHGMILGRGATNSANTAGSSNTVLVAQTTKGCTNPNCKARKRSTHTTENCYWPGGGKEGQFPPNFGNRAKANITTTTPTAPTPSSNNPTSPTSQTEHFVLAARVLDTPGRSGILIKEFDDLSPAALISKGFQGFQNGKTPTFLDSGASDMMFVSKDAFIDYKSISSRIGESAKATNGDFEIIGEGNVNQRYIVNGGERDVTYTRALHTPSLNANLVSVSALDKAGLTTTFGNGEGVVRKADGTTVLAGKEVNGMYLLEPVSSKSSPLALNSLSKSTSLEQWHRRLAHCSPSTIKDMATGKLVDGLTISGDELSGKCENCIMGRQTRRPFDGETDKSLDPLELVSFDLWGPSRTQSASGKVYMMIMVDAGTSCKYGDYLADKSDATTIAAFEVFRTQAETATGRQIRRIRCDGAFDTAAWKAYCQPLGIKQEFTAPYSSSQNGLAERAIRTTIEDVRTLIHDSGLGHSYWAEGAAYSIYTRNLIPSRRFPGKIPLESFTGKRQSVSHLRVFGAKCWAKIPTLHGAQVTGGSKLDPRSVQCRFLGYATGAGNYKVQAVETRRVYVSRDVIFEEGQPRRTLTSVGEEMVDSQILFDTLDTPPANIRTSDHDDPEIAISNDPDLAVDNDPVTQPNIARPIPVEPQQPPRHQDNITAAERRSTRAPKPSQGVLHSMEYRKREETGKEEGLDWATNTDRPKATSTVSHPPEDRENFIACFSDTKGIHYIPHSYKEAMTTDPARWMTAMETEMATLKAKRTWDLVLPPPDANIMDSMWVYDIKWDGQGNRIKDKARLVGKGYTQRFGVDYNETWAAVARLESVRMTSAIAAKLDLKLWRLDFVGAYLNSTTKEDIYMRQAEGFVELGFEDHVAKLLHTIYGTMQGGHDWYETLCTTYDDLDYVTSRADPCVRIKEEDGNYTITNTYTDDTYGASNSEEEERRRKEEIGKVWEIKDVGETEYFLGMRVQQDLGAGTIRLTQRPYWEHVVHRFSLEHIPPRNTPLPVGIALDNNMSPKTDSERKQMAGKPYRAILGSVMWGQLATRPDLSFAVSLLARFQINPGIDHWNGLMHVIGYIKNTLDYGLTYYRDSDLSPIAYVDADYGGCRDTRRSTSGYVFIMAGGAVTWSSKRQTTVALSTVEAEYVAMSRCAQQMTWMQSWMSEANIKYELPGIIRGDNRGAIALTKNTRDHGKVKHIDIRHHYIRELLQSGTIAMEQVSSADNLADIFTKPLPRDHHHRLLNALNIQ